jgi:hypothetical protein
MKKLELNQMENLEGGGQGRDCFLMGVATGGLVLGAIFNPVGTFATVYAGGGIGGFFTSVDHGCF